MHSRNQGSRWPTMGAANARYTRASIEHGPGVIIRRVGGASSPYFCVMQDPFQGRLRTAGDIPSGEAQAATGSLVWRSAKGIRNGQFGRPCVGSNGLVKNLLATRG